MAVTITLYNHTAKLFANSEVTLSTLKLILLNDDAAALFDATDTDMSGLTGAEVSGNGWAAGGELLASVAVTTVTSNDAKLDAADISKTATGGAIGPAEAAVLWDDTGDQPLAFIDFGAAKTADLGTPFNVNWNASGIITWSYA